MTDRERLLEQAREAEERAAHHGNKAAIAMACGLAYDQTRWTAHYALTALALRDVIRVIDSLQKTRDEMPNWGAV